MRVRVRARVRARVRVIVHLEAHTAGAEEVRAGATAGEFRFLNLPPHLLLESKLLVLFLLGGGGGAAGASLGREAYAQRDRTSLMRRLGRVAQQVV